MLHDLSPLIGTAIGVWPGDTPPQREVLLDLAKGDNVTLSTLRSTVHVGSHVDAPSHYGLDAPSMEQCDLDRYIGLCQVIPVAVQRGRRVTVEAIGEEITAPRVLLSTGTFPDPNSLNPDFAGLEPTLIAWLAEREVKLVGVDTPSVDLFASKDLEAHQACLRCDVAILEGLVLDAVPAGLYELIALPLRLEGFDASPVRAVLRDIPKG